MNYYIIFKIPPSSGKCDSIKEITLHGITGSVDCKEGLYYKILYQTITKTPRNRNK